jgi:hypothetical protein
MRARLMSCLLCAPTTHFTARDEQLYHKFTGVWQGNQKTGDQKWLENPSDHMDVHDHLQSENHADDVHDHSQSHICSSDQVRAGYQKLEKRDWSTPNARSRSFCKTLARSKISFFLTLRLGDFLHKCRPSCIHAIDYVVSFVILVALIS